MDSCSSEGLQFIEPATIFQHKFIKSMRRQQNSRFDEQSLKRMRYVKDLSFTETYKSSNQPLPLPFPLSPKVETQKFKNTRESLNLLVDNMFKQFKETKVEKVVNQPRPQSSSTRKCLPLPQKQLKHDETSKRRTLSEQPEEKQQKIQKTQPPSRKNLNLHSNKKQEFKLQQLLEKLNVQDRIVMTDQDVNEIVEQVKQRPVSSNIYMSKRPANRPPLRKLQKPTSQSFEKKQQPKDRYQIMEVLGQGAYAIVRKANDTLTNKIVAIKSYSRKQAYTMESKDACLRELRFLQKLEHKSIVKLLAVIQTRNALNLVLEYIGKQSLYMVLRGKLLQSIYLIQKERVNHRFNEVDFKQYFIQIVQAVEYCHIQGIVHRDIKIENILVNGSQVKLIDFGLASYSGSALLTTFCGTPSYMSPEVCQRRPYKGEKADIWALGIVMHVSLSGKFPFEGKNDEDLFRSIQKTIYKPPNHLSTDAKSLLSSIISKIPSSRPSATEILAHNWLQV